MNRHYYHLLLFGLVLLLWNCAQVAPLTGGARDTAPPKLKEAVPQNASSNFSGNTILLTFNEYVQIKDIRNQLIVTPSLKTDPEISAEGKKIKIKLKPEELDTNTTYRIFFGRAIADVTEGNAAEGFQYVFSTGNTIDSLKMSGVIHEALSNDPVTDAIVGLYPVNAPDSAIFNSKPQYIGRTNSSGNFELNYLPAKSFRVYAFRDKNKNYLYDGEKEEIAFLKDPVSAEKDTALKLILFSEAAGKYFVKKTFLPRNGLLHIIYNKKGVFDVKALNTQIRYKEKNPGMEKDTISIYYYSTGTDSINFKITERNGKAIDTIQALIPKLNPNRKKTFSVAANINNGNLAFDQALKFFFSTMPDTNAAIVKKMKLYQKTDSSLVQLPFTIKYTLPDEAMVKAKLKPGMNYIFKIDTAAFFDFNERYNDSLLFAFKTQSKDELGKLTLNFTVSKKQSYIIQLLNEQERVVREVIKSYALNSSTSGSIEFTDLPAGTYKVRVVYDDNENKKWDTGDVMKKIQPEKILFILSR